MTWLKLDKPGRDVDSLVGEIAMPLDDIVPGAVGRAELRGTVWSARNAARSRSSGGSAAGWCASTA